MKLRPAMELSKATMKPGRTRGWSGKMQCGLTKVRSPSEKKKKLPYEPPLPKSLMIIVAL
jgi:hypothetical protein